MEIHYTKVRGLSGTVVIMLLVQLGGQLVLADEINPGLYSPNSNPFGTPFSTWTSKWWQWFIGIANSQHPFPDTSGEKCGIKQAGPIWYLVGAAGKVERNCVIPSDKAILFPILNTECSYSESPNLKTEQALRNCAVESNKDAVLKASIDNQQIKDIEKYRVTTNLFNVTYHPTEPVFPTNSNSSQAVSDGWFIMLEPLKPGTHELKFAASQLGAGSTGENTVMDVKYNLIVK